MTVRSVRPTIRCLREDLGVVKLPPATIPLHDLDHVVLRKACSLFSTADRSGERIRAIDDHMFFKVKVERWRGAVWRPLPAQWLVAAGRREAGSPDDFYEAMSESARRWRAERNRRASPSITTDTETSRLLPDHDDEQRLTLEHAVRAVDEFRATVRQLVLGAARAGGERTDEAGGYSLAVLVRRTEIGEVYVGIRIQGPVEPNAYAVILDAVPAVADRESWFVDHMPHRSDRPGEVVWSNLLDEQELKRALTDP
jgi:hypothetical protein